MSGKIGKIAQLAKTYEKLSLMSGSELYTSNEALEFINDSTYLYGERRMPNQLKEGEWAKIHVTGTFSSGLTELIRSLQNEIKDRRNKFVSYKTRLTRRNAGNAKGSQIALKYEVEDGQFTGRIIRQKAQPQPIRLFVTDAHIENMDRMMSDIEESSLEGIDQFLNVDEWITDEDDWFAFT